jgi:hypothetical protein
LDRETILFLARDAKSRLRHAIYGAIYQWAGRFAIVVAVSFSRGKVRGMLFNLILIECVATVTVKLLK